MTHFKTKFLNKQFLDPPKRVARAVKSADPLQRGYPQKPIQSEVRVAMAFAFHIARKDATLTVD